MKKRYSILITGVNGFLGSKLAEFFIKKNFIVKGTVRKTSNLTFLKPFSKKIKLYYADIREKESLRGAFKNTDFVIHSAAYASDWGKFETFYDINVNGVKNICELCIEFNIKHLVHISSTSIYGFDTRINADEDTKVIKNKFPYCVTKLEGEKVVKHFIKNYNLPATIVQPGVVYGPNDRTTSYKLIDALLKRRMVVGEKGKYFMSPTYIGNLTQGIFLILTKRNISRGKTYIITDDIKMSWGEFFGLFCKALNMPFPKISIPAWLGWAVAYISEGLYTLLGIDSPPSITGYRVAISTSHFHFKPGKIMRELGYKPDKQIEKHIKETVEAYFQWKKQR